MLPQSSDHASGIYMAYPTSLIMKSIWRQNPPRKDYEAKVNYRHTKVGQARHFGRRARDYLKNFDGQIRFVPICAVNLEELDYLELLVTTAMYAEFPVVPKTREWYVTTDRERVREIVLSVLGKPDRSR